jgi:S1-C subfamily serine protease
MRAAALAGLALCILLAGCALGRDPGRGGATASGPPTIERNTIEASGGEQGLDAEAIYEATAPGVVTIISVFGRGGEATLGGSGLGSGFVVDERGHVATNAHVVASGRSAPLEPAKRVFVEFADGNRVPAEVLGADPFSDVALLEIDPGGLTLTPLELGSSETLAVGEPVAAIGSPFGERQSLSIGVISALDRDIESLTRFQIGDAIQTDAAINQGNSGGPLLDAEGRVLGINAQIRSTSGGGVGVGYAIPVDTVRRSLEQLEREGEVSYGYLGVSSQDLYPQLADRLGVDAEAGALVTQVAEGSPAEETGLDAGEGTITFQGQPDIPEGGDVIVAADGREIDRHTNLADVIETRAPGTEVELEVVRGDEHRDVTVTLADRPTRVPAG